MMLENERLVKKFANATKDSKVVFMRLFLALVVWRLPS